MLVQLRNVTTDLQSRMDGQRVDVDPGPATTTVRSPSLLCTPNSLSQEVGTALGAQAGETRLREIIQGAGFGRVRRVAETPFNIVLEARP